jgi:beta-phosphoglucomutase-like phosphatase (HAD superfamily)
MPFESYVFLVVELKRLRDVFFSRRHNSATVEGGDDGKEALPVDERQDEEEEEANQHTTHTEMEHLSDALLLLLQIFAAVASSDSAENARLKTTLAEAGLLETVIGS